MIRRQYLIHLLLALAIATGAAFPASVAVVLQALWSSMTADLGQASTLRLIFGAMPTSLYLMAPIACVIAIAWLFWLNSQSVTLQVMFAAGMSVFRCALPALLLAVTLTVGAFIDAWIVAPRGVAMVEDVKHALKRDFALGSLSVAKFHTFEFGSSSVSMSFRKKLGDDRFEGVFVSVRPRDGKGYTVVARTASFAKSTEGLSIHFNNGSRQTSNDQGRLIVTTFSSFVRTFSATSPQGAVRQRLTAPELGARDLIAFAFSRDPGQAWRSSLARSELAKRVIIPAMNLSHALLAIGLLFVIGPARVRLGNSHVRVILAIAVLHVVAVAGIELFARQTFFVHGLLLAVMVAEMGVGIALMRRASKTTRDIRLPAVGRQERAETHAVTGP